MSIDYVQRRRRSTSSNIPSKKSSISGNGVSKYFSSDALLYNSIPIVEFIEGPMSLSGHVDLNGNIIYIFGEYHSISEDDQLLCSDQNYVLVEQFIDDIVQHLDVVVYHEGPALKYIQQYNPITKLRNHLTKKRKAVIIELVKKSYPYKLIDYRYESKVLYEYFSLRSIIKDQLHARNIVLLNINFIKFQWVCLSIVKQFMHGYKNTDNIIYALSYLYTDEYFVNFFKEHSDNKLVDLFVQMEYEYCDLFKTFLRKFKLFVPTIIKSPLYSALGINHDKELIHLLSDDWNALDQVQVHNQFTLEEIIDNINEIKPIFNKLKSVVSDIHAMLMDVYFLLTFLDEQPKHSIVYVGDYHAEFYRKFFQYCGYRIFDTAFNNSACLDVRIFAQPLFINIPLDISLYEHDSDIESEDT